MRDRLMSLCLVLLAVLLAGCAMPNRNPDALTASDLDVDGVWEIHAGRWHGQIRLERSGNDVDGDMEWASSDGLLAIQKLKGYVKDNMLYVQGYDAKCKNCGQYYADNYRFWFDRDMNLVAGRGFDWSGDAYDAELRRPVQ